MIIGILGKGGTGKSTLTREVVSYLHSSNKFVLAIDADHNMDTLFNLGIDELPNYLGSSLIDVKKAVGLSPEADYREVFLTSRPTKVFKLNPIDEFTNKYSKEVKNGLRVMAAGPQTDDVLFDMSCSHVLFTALKLYLPLLSLNKDEWVVVDEKAGADGVTTGIVSGMDACVVVSDASPHGMKTARQIFELLDHFSVPGFLVANKAEAEDIVSIEEGVGHRVCARLGFSKKMAYGENTLTTAEIQNLINIISAEVKTGAALKRTIDKFQRNHHYQSSIAM